MICFEDIKVLIDEFHGMSLAIYDSDVWVSNFMDIYLDDLTNLVYFALLQSGRDLLVLGHVHYTLNLHIHKGKKFMVCHTTKWPLPPPSLRARTTSPLISQVEQLPH
jgi:hypothetical protein